MRLIALNGSVALRLVGQCINLYCDYKRLTQNGRCCRALGETVFDYGMELSARLNLTASLLD
jgi:hypothetical protein